ncbi:hypothetical protein ACLHTJ_04435 [Pseudomonas aeruginosa]|uniref:hypothetical protein n=1 Tax=Pseudomonas aeruginosa TaxID=287 RepID=UPI003983A5D2
MKVFYKGQKQEHYVNGIETAVVLVGTEELVLNCSYVKATNDFESVVKLLTEEKSESKSKKSISLVVSDDNYAERYELARAYRTGLYFIGGQHIESLVGYSALEIDEYAAQAGALKNLKRFVASVARQVPFSMTRDQAAEMVANAASSMSYSDADGVDSAIELLNKTIDSDVISYQKSRKINFDSQIVGNFLSHRTPGTEASEELEAYAAKIFKEGGVHALSDGMGKGKTKHVIRKLIEAGIATGEKSTFLTHRISIARSNAIADLVEQYDDESIKGREDQLQSLSLVINKCDNERFRAHTHQCNIIILDESAQVLRHMMQKGFVGDRNDVFHEIISLIKNARLVLFCDAFMNDVLMNYVRLAGRPINFMQGSTDYSSINVCLGAVESVQRETLRAFAAQKKVLFSSDSRKQAETVARIALDQSKKVLLVTQATKDKPEVVEFFANPNEAIKKYDVLCHSPSMQSSVSITVEHFDAHFCIFGGVVGIDDAKQFIRRDRTAKKIIVGIHHTTNFAVESKDAMANFYRSGDQVFDSIAFQQLHLSAREMNHFQQWLSISFEQDGFTMSRLPTEKAADDEASRIFKSGRKAVKEAVTKGTLEVGKSAVLHKPVEGATGKEKEHFDGLIRFEKASNEMQYHFNNFLDVAEATGKFLEEITEDDVTFFNEGAGLPKIKNMKCWLLSDERFQNLVERDEKLTGIDRGHYADIRKHLTNVMQLLGIAKSGDGVISDVGLREACKYIAENQLDFKMNGLVSIKIEAKSERQMHSLISDLLSKMGLSKARKMVNGERIYVLNNEQFNQMCSYVNPESRASSQDEKVWQLQNLLDCDEETARVELFGNAAQKSQKMCL